MATIPTPRTWVTAEVVTAAYMNGVRDALTFLLAWPAVKVYHTTTQAIATATSGATALTWDSELGDNDAMHSTVTNPTRLTIVTAGDYLVSFGVQWAHHATGTREVRLLKNGTVVQVWNQPTITNGASPACWQGSTTEVLNLIAGDYLELAVRQDSGVSLNVTGGTNSSHFAARMVST